MPNSLLTLNIAKNPHKDLAFFRFKKQENGNYLLTTDNWQFCILSESDFITFVKTGRLENDSKYNELVYKWFVKTSLTYEEDEAQTYRQRNQFLWFGPALHMIVTTLRCNHKCKYCHAAVAPMTAKELDMSLETAEKVVDTIFYTTSPHVTIEFQWWESLVNWEVVEFVVKYSQQKAHALKKALHLTLVTNLSLMTEEKLQFLIENEVGVCTSMDGDKETHNWQRTYLDGDSHDLVKYWIKRANSLYEKAWSRYRVGALLTLTKPALKNYRKIIDAYVELWLKSVWLRWLNPYGFALAEREQFYFDTDEFISFFREAMDYIIEINKSWYHLAEMISSVYISKILTGTDPNFMDIRSPSGPAIGCLAYNYDGSVYASDESRMLARMGINDFCLTPLLDSAKETYDALAQSQVTNILVQTSTLDGLPWYNDHVYKPYIGADTLFAYTQYGNPYSIFSKDERNLMQLARVDYLFEKMQDDSIMEVFKKWI